MSIGAGVQELQEFRSYRSSGVQEATILAIRLLRVLAESGGR